MKKLTLTFYLANTIALSLLLFDQQIGINILTFNIVSSISLFILFKPKFNGINTIKFILPLLSAIGCMLYGNTLSIVAYIISYLIFISSIHEHKLSSFTSFIMGVISITASFIDRVFKPKPSQPAIEKKDKKIDPLLTIGIIITFLIFLLIYGLSNPLFGNLLSKINLDFISFRWIIFTLIIGYFTYGVFYFLHEKSIIKWDVSNSFSFSKNISFKKGLFNQHNLLRSGTILFALLNVLLLFVNLTDLYYYVISPESLTGVTFSNALHQSIGNLITSVILAIVLILYFFKGSLNFNKKNKALKILAIIWMIQNVILVFFAAHKNGIYINDYGLTLKRVGVYMYLLLTTIGLILTVYKITAVKTNWFIIHNFFLTIVLSLGLSSLLPWENYVINYNITQHIEENKALDVDYITTLSTNTIPVLLNKRKTLVNSITKEELQTFDENLRNKIWKFKKQTIHDWPSWTVAKHNIYNN